jgi:BRO family, N-terminal domain
MTKESAVKLFDQHQIRSLWDDENEKWYFSIVDIIAVLTDQPTHQAARNYWKVLKSRLLKEGNETVTNCNRLKLSAEDGKLRETDVADTEQIFRLVQSIPSRKAEPFKIWLAKVARERMDEIEDPEIGIERLMETYLKKG